VLQLAARSLDVVVVDHGSTYPEMVEWLDGIGPNDSEAPRAAWGYPGSTLRVLRRGNAHPRDLWTNGTIAELVAPGERFIVTDCDVVPDVACPPNWVAVLWQVLNENPWAVKAGLGLRLDGLPSHYEHRDRVRQWEAQWWAKTGPMVHGVPLYRAGVDTTLALYRAPEEPFAIVPSLRTGGFYQARHLPWYEDSGAPTAEEVYYRERSTPGVSHWLDPVSYATAAQVAREVTGEVR